MKKDTTIKTPSERETKKDDRDIENYFEVMPIYLLHNKINRCSFAEN